MPPINQCLVSAVVNKEKKRVKQILAKERVKDGVNVNYKDDYGTPVICLAVQSGCLEIVQMLMDCPEIEPDAMEEDLDLDGDIENAIYHAVYQNNLEMVKLLASHPKVNVARIYPYHKDNLLHIPNDPSVLEFLLTRPEIDVNHVNNEGSTPLAAATTWKGHIYCVKKLIDHPKVDVNLSNPFFLACKRWNPDFVRFFLDAKSKVVNFNATSSTGDTGFLWCCRNNNLEVVKLLLSDKRVCTDSREHNTDNGLFLALKGGHIGVAEVILYLNPKSRSPKIALTNFKRTFVKNSTQTQLLNEFLEAPYVFLKRVEKKHGFELPMVAQVLALVTLHSDGYLTPIPKVNSKAGKNNVRFLSICGKLPFEIQSRICNLKHERNSFFVKSAVFEENLKTVLKMFVV